MIRDISIGFTDLKYYGNETQEQVKLANSSTHKDVDLFLRLLSESKLKIGGKIEKINIDFTENQKQLDFKSSPISDIVSVFNKLPFNSLNDYLNLTNNEKSKFILKYIIDAFKEFSKKTDIDMNLIKSIAKKCEDVECKNNYYFGKLKNSKDRKHKAGIWIEHEMEVFKIYLDLLDKEEELIKRGLVAETLPGYPKYFPLLGGIKWINNDKVEFFNRKKEILQTLSA